MNKQQNQEYLRLEKKILKLAKKLGKKVYNISGGPNDLTQMILLDIFLLSDSKKYDPTKGSENTWLYYLARSRIGREHQKQQTQKRGGDFPRSKIRILDQHEDTLIELFDLNNK